MLYVWLAILALMFIRPARRIMLAVPLVVALPILVYRLRISAQIEPQEIGNDYAGVPPRIALELSFARRTLIDAGFRIVGMWRFDSVSLANYVCVGLDPSRRVMAEAVAQAANTENPRTILSWVELSSDLAEDRQVATRNTRSAELPTATPRGPVFQVDWIKEVPRLLRAHMLLVGQCGWGDPVPCTTEWPDRVREAWTDAIRTGVADGRMKRVPAGDYRFTWRGAFSSIRGVYPLSEFVLSRTRRRMRKLLGSLDPSGELLEPLPPQHVSGEWGSRAPAASEILGRGSGQSAQPRC